jgi:arylsulfatase A-like enzyme
MTKRSLLLVLWLCGSAVSAADRPNVLWITCEDTGPQLGCYGDAYSVTPNLDEFAKTACRYLHCWSNAPVCAPARTTIITGMYPTSLGAEHMRSQVKLPANIRLYPQYLMEAGYYCTNNSKTDYNVEPVGKVWDDSSNKAHWKNRPEGKPFFAIFNHTITHESQIRNAIDAKDRIHDPAGVRVPAYHPDTPEVRKDWAQYYDRITMMDKLFAQNLQELRDAGLADDTIVFFYGDHGSGMPRSKRFPYNSGLHVPLLIHVPEKWKGLATADCVQGGTSDRLVSFVDLAPTLLSLCGAEIPAHTQGHAFLGPKATEPQPYIYGFRGRMDERIDMMRSVTDGRYVYIRNFMPHLPYGQHVDYMFQTPTTRVWYEKFLKGELNEAQSHFWQEKPAEELYDLQSDRDEVVNLLETGSPRPELELFRNALRRHIATTGDLGFLPEAEIHRRASSSLRELGQSLQPTREFWSEEDRLGAIATIANASTTDEHPALGGVLSDFSKIQSLMALASSDRYFGAVEPAVRYWIGVGLIRDEAEGVAVGRVWLHQSLADESPSVRIVAAEALGRFGNNEDLALALPVLLEHANAEQHGVYNAVAALNAIDRLGEKADSIRDQVAKLPRKDPKAPERTAAYCDRLIQKITDESEPRRATRRGSTSQANE